MSVRIESDTCRVEGCDNPRLRQSSGRRYSLCQPHRGRWIQFGDLRLDQPFKRQAHRGSGTRTRDGYIADRIVGHPLAGARGRVLRHRRVLYDAIGPGAHQCHWCPTSLAWEDGTLEVDHLDGVPDNNDRANLVPSCGPCNKKRASAGNPLQFAG